MKKEKWLRKRVGRELEKVFREKQQTADLMAPEKEKESNRDWGRMGEQR